MIPNTSVAKPRLCRSFVTSAIGVKSSGCPRVADRSATRGHPELFTPIADVTKLLHNLGFATEVFGIIDLARFELELQLHQLFLDRSIIRELLANDAVHLI